MAAGLPAAVPMLAQQQLAARGPASAGGQQLRGVSAMPQVAAAAAAQAEARRLAGKKRKPTDKAASEKVGGLLVVHRLCMVFATAFSLNVELFRCI